MKEGCGLFLPVQAMLRAFDEGQNAGWSPLVEVDTSSVQMLTPHMKSTAEEFLGVYSVSLDTLTTINSSISTSSATIDTAATVSAMKSVALSPSTVTIHRASIIPSLHNNNQYTAGKYSITLLHFFTHVCYSFKITYLLCML